MFSVSVWNQKTEEGIHFKVLSKEDIDAHLLNIWPNDIVRVVYNISNGGGMTYIRKPILL